jgi:HEPN domain-containing protein
LELLYSRIYDIAKTDLEAANILAKNGLYPQAIYFYSQACEKAAKSVIAIYLIHHEKKTNEEVLKILKSHGHNLLKLAETTTKIFVDYEKGLYVKRGGKETDELIRTANESMKKIQGRKPDIQELMAYYASNVKVLYERLYARLSENYSPKGAEDPGFGVLREVYKIPKTKHLKFNTLSQFLFILLDEMDIYSRYPMNDNGYPNIVFLKEPQIREACSLLGIMVGDLISLVPLVWNKVESLKTS